MAEKPTSHGPPPACPVDHTTRAAWLEAAAKEQQQQQSTTSPAPSTTCDSTSLSPPSAQHPSSLPPNHPLLSTLRQISSIPRSSSPNTTSPNSESPDPHTSPSGHWVYPSEQQFFAAMQRKNNSPNPTDMSSIVPIHNAVNERAWSEILRWESHRGRAAACGGPKLVSFRGDSTKLTPKARLMILLGYQPPFDRHDWTIDRCGQNIDYVIDFYSGKRDPQRPEAVSFYLDVRPKVNSVEGVVMRLGRFFSGFFGSS
ncbi:cytochrome c/c1 heme-lyase [Terfezia claveryi]|nr:cytochrome c/c1 heme-lyase [Terfezia claveryi]